jgi:hypothetical protein
MAADASFNVLTGNDVEAQSKSRRYYFQRCQISTDLFEVDKLVDRPQQVVSGDMPFERELIEQRSLFDSPMPHHDLQSCQLDRLDH